MKGSIKVKFDFGWALSLVVAILLVVGAAARISFTYSVQTKASDICHINSVKTAAEYPENDKIFNYDNFYESCKVVNMKPNMQVALDFDSWTYYDVYPKLEAYKY